MTCDYVIIHLKVNKPSKKCCVIPRQKILVSEMVVQFLQVLYCTQLQSLTGILKMEKTMKWENADWGIFTDTLASQQLQVRTLLKEKRLDTMVNKLYSALNRALDLACPKTLTKIVDKNNPWWISCLLYTSPSPRD